MPAHFNQILLLDSLPEDERGSYRRLAEEVTSCAARADQPPSVVKLRVLSFGQFADVIRQLTEKVQELQLVPLVHLECHGGPDGVEFADGSRATWLEFKDALTPLNSATGLNLIVVVSACNGGDLAGAVRTTEPAPVWGLVGPNRVMTAHELEQGFSAFYRELLRTEDSEAALKALRATAEPGAYMVLTAEVIFREVLAGYRDRHETPEAQLARATALRDRARAAGAHWDLDDVLAMIRDPSYLRAFYRVFFLVDRWPGNAERFPEIAMLGPPLE